MMMETYSICFDEQAAQSFDPVVEGEVEATDMLTIPVEHGLETIEEDEPLPDTVEDFSTKNMSKFIFIDPWLAGFESFEKKDVLRVRAERVRRLEVKCKVQVCILNGMKDLANRAVQVIVGQEMTVQPSWSSFLRSRQNNLGLK